MKITLLHVFDKEIISQIYKELSNLYSKKNNPMCFKMSKRFQQPFIKEDLQTANKHMKKCSVSLLIKECELKKQQDTTTHLLKWQKLTSHTKYWQRTCIPCLWNCNTVQ